MYIGNIPHLILYYHKKSENGREISVARRFFFFGASENEKKSFVTFH